MPLPQLKKKLPVRQSQPEDPSGKLQKLARNISELDTSSNPIMEFIQNNFNHPDTNLVLRIIDVCAQENAKFNTAFDKSTEKTRINVTGEYRTHKLPLSSYIGNYEEGKLNIVFASTNPGKNREFVEYLNENSIYGLISSLFKYSHLEDIGITNLKDTEENTYSFIMNARNKANQNAKFIEDTLEEANNSERFICISEDSGLIVPQLDGMQPGIVSARYHTLEENKPALKRIEDATGSILKNLSATTKNNLVLLDNLFEYYRVRGEKPAQLVPAFLSTTASASMYRQEISNRTGTLSGHINLNLYTSYRYGRINFHQFLAYLQNSFGSPMGYNPIFIPNGTRTDLDSLNAFEKSNNDHRSKAFSAVFVDILETVANGLWYN